MLKYRETMIDVTEQDINYLNASVKEINEHVGYEFISIESDPDGEDESVIIYEDGLETWSGYSFESTEMYLKGIKLGFKLDTRKGKSYDDMKKLYDENDESTTLGVVFYYWWKCGNMNAKNIKAAFDEGDEQCKEYILQDPNDITDKEEFYKIVRILTLGHK